MLRMQIQLTDDQAAALRRAAEAGGVSLAAVVRGLVDAHLTRADEAPSLRARAAVGRFRSGGGRTSRDHDAELERAYSA